MRKCQWKLEERGSLLQSSRKLGGIVPCSYVESNFNVKIACKWWTWIFTHAKIQRVLEVRPGLFLLLSKMQKQRDKLKEEIINMKEFGFDDLWKSQPIQTTKDTKIKSFMVRKACSMVKTKGMAGQSFFSTSERLKRSEHSVTQKGSLKRLSVWLTGPLSHLDRSQKRDQSIYRGGDQQDSWECYTSRNTASLYWKGQRGDKNERKLYDLQNSTGKKQADKTPQLQTMLPLMKKEWWLTHKVEPSSPRIEPRITDEVLKPKLEFALLDFKIA